MRSQLLLCRMIVLLFALTSARIMCASSPDYVVTTSTGAVIVPGDTDVGNHCDDCVTNDIPLPFPVIFYDQVFTTCDVSSNGHLTFTSAINSDYNFCLPHDIDYLIVPLAGDLYTVDTASGQGIFTSVSGTAPNRIFNIEWRTKYCCSGGPPVVNFEIRLYESQRRIDFIYGSIASDVPNSKYGIGVQSTFAGGQSTIVSCGSIPAPGTQYTFTLAETCVPPPPNMIAWWRGDGNADDSIGGYNGSLMVGATFAAGEVGQAFSLNGTGAHIAVGDVDVPATFTIDAWINPTDLSSNPRIFSKDDDTTARSYELRATAAGYLEAVVYNAAATGSQTFYRTNTAPIVAGSFQHVAVTYDGSASAGEKLKFYVNGVNIPASPVIGNDAGGTPNNTSVAAVIGIAGNRQTGPFNGLIDEVEVFDRVLSPDEIAGIFIVGSAGKCKCTPPPDNMVSWWPGEGDGNDIQDGNTVSAGNGNGFGFGAGEVGSAFTFDGNFSQFATAGTPSNLAITTEHVTIDGWINPSVSPTGFTLLFGHALSGGHDYALLFDTDLVGAIKTDNGDPGLEHFVHTGYNPPLNTWTHVALTYDGSTITVYANGVVVGAESKTGIISNSGGPFNIGGRVDCCFYTGAIDEVEVFNATLSGDDIAKIYHAGSAGKCRSCTPAPNGMVDWWPGDGDANDIQGGHSGTLTNGASFSPGEVGSAFSLDGSNDYVDVGNVDVAQTFTIDAWIYPQTTGGAPRILSRSDIGGPGGYEFRINPTGRLDAIVFTGTGATLVFYQTGNAVVTLGTWQHVAMTYDGNAGAGAKVAFYVNGVSVPVSASSDDGGTTFLNTAITAKIGINGDGSTGPFLGLIDEVEIFDHVLSGTEVAAIYDAGSAGKCKPAVPAKRQLANISTRASVGTGDNVAIGGFIIHSDPAGGTSSVRGPGIGKTVIIRGLGPSLQVNGSALSGRLEDPWLELRAGNGDLIATNDDWQSDQGIDIQNTGLAPSDPKEAAILATLSADKGYTAILRGKDTNGDPATGIGLVEIYDLQPTGNSHLANISTRGFVDTGDNVLIGGIIVRGNSPSRVLVRALGPSLTGLGVPGALADPVLELRDANGALLESNDDWGSSPEVAAITASGLAPNNPKESAILFGPAPGAYTAIVSGGGATPTGIGMVEAYRLSN